MNRRFKILIPMVNFALSTLFLLLTNALTASAGEPVRVAILPFTDQVKPDAPRGVIVTDILFSELSSDATIELVERDKINAVFDELSLSRSGLTSTAKLTRIGQLAGARLLITGLLFQLGNRTYLGAKIISTETGRVIGTQVTGANDPAVLAQRLAPRLTDLLHHQVQLQPVAPPAPPSTAQPDILPLGTNRPRLYIEFSNEHLGTTTFPPIAADAFKQVAQKYGFPIVAQRHQADVIIIGHAFSRQVAQNGTLISVHARAQAKAESPQGKELTSGRQTAVGVENSESASAQSSQHQAGRLLAEALLPCLTR